MHTVLIKERQHIEILSYILQKKERQSVYKIKTILFIQIRVNKKLF